MARKKLNSYTVKALNPSSEPLPPALTTTNQNGFLSLVNSDAFARAVEAVPPDFWERPEDELAMMAEPSRIDYALKCSLWNELRRASLDPLKEKRIGPKEIFGGICSEAQFYNHVLGNPAKVAWLLSPIRDFSEMIQPLLYRWLEREWELLNLPLRNEKGKLMPSVAKLVAQVGKQIEDRALGMPVDRKAHLHAGIGAGKTPAIGSDGTDSVGSQERRMEQIEKRLRELDAADREAMHLPPQGQTPKKAT